MSLISEALRKVRQDGATGDPTAPRMTPPPPRSPRRPSSNLGVAVGVLVGAAAAIAGGAVVWWALAERPTSIPVAAVADDAGGPAGQTEVGEPAAAAGQPATPDAVVPTPPLPANDVGDRVVEVLEQPLPARPTRPPVIADLDAPAPPVAMTVAPSSAPQPTPAATHGPDGELVFVLDAEIDGVSLSLDYIIFRPTNPFAAVNGHDVVVGSIVEGFLVEEISEHKIRLSKAGQTVILRSR
jgi:hypothetical protein